MDHGLYCYIGPEDRKNLCNLWLISNLIKIINSFKIIFNIRKSIILKDENKMKLYSAQLNVEGSLNFIYD